MYQLQEYIQYQQYQQYLNALLQDLMSMMQIYQFYHSQQFLLDRCTNFVLPEQVRELCLLNEPYGCVSHPAVLSPSCYQNPGNSLRSNLGWDLHPTSHFFVSQTSKGNAINRLPKYSYCQKGFYNLNQFSWNNAQMKLAKMKGHIYKNNIEWEGRNLLNLGSNLQKFNDLWITRAPLLYENKGDLLEYFEKPTSMYKCYCGFTEEIYDYQ